ncbi:30S ribosomal protein S13 [Candidatus Bathyarchaeota archaeon]|nr:MAG: 30S ribosomal protein S13 [Candidatus Bathyarchaeota archaeon]
MASEGFRHIVRICGTDIDGSKKLMYGLAKIVGVGVNFAYAIAKALGFDPNMRVGLLTDDDVKKIEEAVGKPEKLGIPSFLFNRQKDFETGLDKHLHGSDLAIRWKMDIDFLKSIKCWRGIRHSLGLKVRGQRTRTTGRKGTTIGVRRRRT